MLLLAAAPAAAQARGPAAYRTVAGDDWTRYAGKADLRAAGRFWWSLPGDVYDEVELVSDPTFGRAVRIRFRQSEQPGYAPKIRGRLGTPLEKMWFRWRMKYTPGWTTVGPAPAGYANSWKMAFWTWEDYRARGGIQLSNGDEYVLEWSVVDPATGRTFPHRVTPLPGSAARFGRAGPAWSDGEWYEFVVFYERTGPAAGRQHYWRRRLTSGGRSAPEPFVYVGLSIAGSPMPRVAAVELGINKNKNNPTTMYLSWGPWEVVDGSRYPNPFGMPGF